MTLAGCVVLRQPGARRGAQASTHLGHPREKETRKCVRPTVGQSELGSLFFPLLSSVLTSCSLCFHLLSGFLPSDLPLPFFSLFSLCLLHFLPLFSPFVFALTFFPFLMFCLLYYPSFLGDHFTSEVVGCSNNLRNLLPQHSLLQSSGRRCERSSNFSLNCFFHSFLDHFCPVSCEQLSSSVTTSGRRGKKCAALSTFPNLSSVLSFPPLSPHVLLSSCLAVCLC